MSQPSVTRFASAVGFSGYPALREQLQAIALGGRGGSAAEEYRGNELQAAVDAEIENLENLRRDFADADRVIDVGRKLAASAPLTVLGLRISVSLAEYFAYAARRVHPDVRLVTRGGTVAYDALLQSREAGGTWVLAFSMPRHAHETLGAVRVARGAGLKVALITDLALGPVVDEADVTFATGTGSRLVFDSYAAPGVMCGAAPGHDRRRSGADAGAAGGVRAGRGPAPVLPAGLIRNGLARDWSAQTGPSPSKQA